MKKLLTIIFITISNIAFSQTDHNGNPVFNSIVFKEEQINDFLLSSAYYTLNDNIANEKSSVFISKSPSLNDIEKAATQLPSDFFIISKDNQAINLLMLQKQKGYSFYIINPTTKANKKIDMYLEGDVTENRANEIVANKYDSNAKIEHGYLFFNNSKLKILPTDTIRTRAIQLIKQEHLNSGGGGQTVFLSQTELRKKILAASKDGGELDFWTPIKGHEYDAVLMEGVVATKLEISVMAWVAIVVRAGISSKNDVISLYEELKNRSASEKDKSMIDYGYKKALEKQ